MLKGHIFFQVVQLEIEEALDLDVAARQHNTQAEYDDAAAHARSALVMGKRAAAQLERLAAALNSGRWSLVRSLVGDHPATRKA